MQLLWYFYIYSFIGWFLEVFFTAYRKKKLVNKGFLNSPLCPIYGICAVAITVLFRDLENQLFFLFLGSLVVSTFLEFTTGHLLQAIFHQKWWDYSDQKFNADGYVCLKFSLFWGLFGVAVNKVTNPVFGRLTGLIPSPISFCILAGLTGIMVCDMIGTVAALLSLRKKKGRIEAINDNLEQFSDHMRHGITGWVERRMQKAYPQVDPNQPVEKKKPAVFAEGNGFYKLASLFFISAYLGDRLETLFMYIKYGKIVSRSSVVYGDFSIVWGLAVVIMSACLYRYRKKSILYVFLIGTVLGGTYEYACSVVSEIVFGTIFWDYSKLPFNLAGRINLLYCFFWGAIAVVWLRIVYPFLSKLIEKIPVKLGKLLCIGLIIFMLFDGLVSAGALMRYRARNNGEQAKTSIEQMFDEHFPDERMVKIYPYAKIVR